MSENWLLLVWFCKIMLVVINSLLYRLGGQINKALRRFAMPIIYIGGCAGISLWKGNFNPLMFISLPLLIGSLHLGYGATNLWDKIRRRALAGLAIAISFLPFAFIFNNWILYTWHCGLCILGSIVFGSFNPFPSAVDEEANVAICYILIPVMMI